MKITGFHYTHRRNPQAANIQVAWLTDQQGKDWTALGLSGSLQHPDHAIQIRFDQEQRPWVLYPCGAEATIQDRLTRVARAHLTTRSTADLPVESSIPQPKHCAASSEPPDSLGTTSKLESATTTSPPSNPVVVSTDALATLAGIPEKASAPRPAGTANKCAAASVTSFAPVKTALHATATPVADAVSARLAASKQVTVGKAVSTMTSAFSSGTVVQNTPGSSTFAPKAPNLRATTVKTTVNKATPSEIDLTGHPLPVVPTTPGIDAVVSTLPAKPPTKAALAIPTSHQSRQVAPPNPAVKPPIKTAASALPVSPSTETLLPAQSTDLSSPAALSTPNPTPKKPTEADFQAAELELPPWEISELMPNREDTPEVDPRSLESTFVPRKKGWWRRRHRKAELGQQRDLEIEEAGDEESAFAPVPSDDDEERRGNGLLGASAAPPNRKKLPLTPQYRHASRRSRDPEKKKARGYDRSRATYLADDPYRRARNKHTDHPDPENIPDFDDCFYRPRSSGPRWSTVFSVCCAVGALAYLMVPAPWLPFG